MEQTRGREKAKLYIILFVVGVFISFASNVISYAGDFAGISWMSLLGFGTLAGLVLQVIAIICLRNVNKNYANALWSLILDLLLTAAIITITLIMLFTEWNQSLDTALTWLDIASDVAEASIVIYFVLGTNQLATECGNGMPKLTKIIIIGYVGTFLVSLVFNLLNLIPAIGGNEIVALVFMIIILSLYVIREIAYIIFLIRALFRVK